MPSAPADDVVRVEDFPPPPPFQPDFRLIGHMERANPTAPDHEEWLRTRGLRGLVRRLLGAL